MAIVSMSIRIDASQQRVFDVFTDLHSASVNITAIEKLEVLTDDPIGKGTRFAETRIMFGKPQTETLEITEWNPPQSYTVDLESYGTRYSTRFTFKPDASGGQSEATLVDVTLTATPLRFAARLMSIMLVFMKSGFRKMFAKDLADLKAAAEGQSIAT